MDRSERRETVLLRERLSRPERGQPAQQLEPVASRSRGCTIVYYGNGGGVDLAGSADELNIL